jgi:hypothetical protein
MALGRHRAQDSDDHLALHLFSITLSTRNWTVLSALFSEFPILLEIILVIASLSNGCPLRRYELLPKTNLLRITQVSE